VSADRALIHRAASVLQKEPMHTVALAVISAGGLCDVYGELKGWTADESMEKAEGIYECLLQLFGNALIEDIPTSQAADNIARRRIAEARRLRNA
jgi:leucine dehydrogenase